MNGRWIDPKQDDSRFILFLFLLAMVGLSYMTYNFWKDLFWVG